MATRALIVGRGFLGQALGEYLDRDGFTVLRSPFATQTLTFTTPPTLLSQLLDELAPDVIINAAGATGRPNVDWCEDNRRASVSGNALWPIALASVAHCHVIHISSGCIFFGRSPHPDGAWREDDPPNPCTVYTRSKAAADIALQNFGHVAQLRLRMPIDNTPGPRNLITKLASYPRVISVRNSLTVVADFLPVVARLIRLRATGVFHVVNPGTISHQEILSLYREHVDPLHQCEFIEDEELVRSGLASVRRSCVELADTRLTELGIELTPVHAAVELALRAYARAV